MTAVFRFNTAKFDVSLEPENPINPIPGASLLEWLQQKAKGAVEVSVPAPEDWGWYSYVLWKERRYLLGASASEAERGEHEWVLQVVKQRSFVERLFGRAAMSHDDECAAYFRGLLDGEAAFKELAAEAER
ncbi:MAG: hypothetical protein JO142_15285 [Burkholderiales bacterium]|nr:hypothetical protein [Burkholderiales bacterium]